MRKKVKQFFKFQPFSQKQRKVLNWWCSTSPVKDAEGIIADGAIRSGKTVSMSLSFVMWAMSSFNGQNFAMCGKTIGSFRRNVLFWLKLMLKLQQEIRYRSTKYPAPAIRRSKQVKAMLSQPMAGKSEEEIKATREKAIATLKEKGYEIVNTLFTDKWYSNEAMKDRGVVQIPLCFLAKSLENMSLCHAAYFCKGWEQARGCRLEHDAAVAYGLDVIYEE